MCMIERGLILATDTDKLSDVTRIVAAHLGRQADHCA